MGKVPTPAGHKVLVDKSPSGSQRVLSGVLASVFYTVCGGFWAGVRVLGLAHRLETQPIHRLGAQTAVNHRQPVVDGHVALGTCFKLHHGGELRDAVMSYRLVGPADAPVVVAIGGISGDRFVASEDNGWWSIAVGPTLALDTERVRILGIDYLGGSGDSTGGLGDVAFPTISAYDQANALALVIKALNFGAVNAVVGASYGGLVALSLAQQHPTLVNQVVAISVAEQPHPHSSAIRAVEREIVRFGLAHNAGADGLKLARALAMCTYRSKREFKERFDAPAEHDGRRLRLPVEDYIFSRGDAYVRKYKPQGFLALSESIDLFRIDATSITVPTTILAVDEDELVPSADSQQLAARLPYGRYIALESRYGHDAFLKEADALKSLLAFLYTPSVLP